MIEGRLHSVEQKIINLASWQTEPHQSACDLYNSSRVGEANLPAVWSLPVLLVTVIKGQNIGIKMLMWKCGDGKQQASAELWDTRHNSLFDFIYALHRDTLSNLHCSHGSCFVYRFTGRMSVQQWRLFSWLRVWLSWQDDVRLHMPTRSAPWSVWQKLYWHW